MESRIPRQGTGDHCLTSRRRRCAEEVAIATVLLRELVGDLFLFIYYYESTKRKLKTKYICGCRCYERLQPNTKEFTRLSYTELVLELEHPSPKSQDFTAKLHTLYKRKAFPEEARVKKLIHTE